ncbi:hypothetical protein NQZ68_032157 [Xyrichtys novacula]|uniref:Uncharacterized protein n=1 Tax=Xyrichtys novacula TaxID=13765 RepID=A0AAV1FQ04_XYRNO|nr:hypothetical protein NQZ68_032157 [Xyrichtys novacula]
MFLDQEETDRRTDGQTDRRTDRSDSVKEEKKSLDVSIGASVPQTRPDGNQVQIHIQVSPKDPRSGPGPVFNNKTTSEDRETCSEKRAEEDKQTRGGGGALQVNRPSLKSALTEKQKVVRSQPGVVFVWASGCRTKSKPSRRFKPPMLPVIAEL